MLTITIDSLPPTQKHFDWAGSCPVHYPYHQHIHQNGFESSVSEAMLPNMNKLFCVHCQNHSGSVALLQRDDLHLFTTSILIRSC